TCGRRAREGVGGPRGRRPGSWISSRVPAGRGRRDCGRAPEGDAETGSGGGRGERREVDRGPGGGAGRGPSASRRRAGQGPRPKPRWGKTLEAKPAAEVGEQVKKLLEAADADGPDARRARRACEALEAIGTPAAKGLAEDLARGAAGARLTEEARGTAERLGR